MGFVMGLAWPFLGLNVVSMGPAQARPVIGLCSQQNPELASLLPPRKRRMLVDDEERGEWRFNVQKRIELRLVPNRSRMFVEPHASELNSSAAIRVALGGGSHRPLLPRL